ncbi:MAG: hypothetical protein Q9175_003861 [Cornicularia normoerica]
MGTVLDLPDLPTDLFLIVTRYLEPVDIVRCRHVSRLWHKEFIEESFLRDVLIREYGAAREVRALLELEVSHRIRNPSGDDSGRLRNVWRRTFDRVLARDRALKSGRPRSVTKRDLWGPLTNLLEKQANTRDRYVPVFPWGRYHRSAGQRRGVLVNVPLEEQVPTDLFETEWTYDSGLLVYPDMIETQAYVLLDIEQDTISVVPFDNKDRIVRRIRLKHNLLVFEWAEKEPYHKLNELEEVHRHYVTAFDVQSAKASFPWLSQWNVMFRCEWKLHYLGFPLSAQDTWFSDHSTTHYAVYIWQTNRSAWGENEPIESLLIWDISQPSNASVEPRLVKKLSYLDLDFLTIRQRDTPFLRKIAIDGSVCVYFFEEGCNRERGSHVGHGYEAGRSNLRDAVWERIVGIPVLGSGPRWENKIGRHSTFTWELQNADPRSPDPLTPKRATCWRYANMGSGIRNQVVRDESAGIKYSVVQRTIGFPEIWVSSDSHSWSTEIDLQDIQWRWKQINGDERYLIIQSNEKLHILHFDYDLGAKEKRGRPFLGTAC